MGRRRTSRKWVLTLPLVLLVGAMTVSYGAGQSAKITTPANGAKVTGTIELSAEVDSPGTVSYCMLVVDGQRPVSTNSTPWTFSLDTRELSDGPHAVSVEAYDSRGLIVASKAITLISKNRAAQPAVTKQPVVAAKKQPVALKTTASVAQSVVAPSGPAPEPAAIVKAAAPHGVAQVKTESSVRSPRVAAILLNDRPLDSDVAPTVVNGQVHGSFRALFVATGARVEWQADGRVARGVSESLVVEVRIGSRLAKVNGQAVDMGAVATLANGRTVVPVRFFAQVTGSKLSWNMQTGVARVNTPTPALAQADTSTTTVASVPLTALITDGTQVATPTVESRGP